MSTRLDLRDRKIAFKELNDALGAEKLLHEETDLVPYAFDSSAMPFRKPSFVVLPENREDVREALKIANMHKIPVTVMSAGVNLIGHTIPSEDGMVIDFRRMNRILEINSDSGYAVIEPGVIFDKFTAALAEKGFRCHVPTSPGGSAPLGNYLLRPSGSLANRHLDPLLDLEVVFPDGTIVNTGSSHFPNAGYSMRYGPFPDLTGLFCCAHGTLGIVTKASIRIYPINGSNRVILTAFDDYESSVKFIKDIVANNIPEHCVIWNWQLYRSFEINYSAEWIPEIPPELMGSPLKPPEGMPYNIVTSLMSGYEESMVVNEKLCKKVAEKYGGRLISKQEAKALAPTATDHWETLYLGYHQDRVNKTFGIGRYMAWIVMAEPQNIPKIEKLAVEKVASLGVAPLGYYSMPFDFGRTMFFRMFIYPNPEDKELLDKVMATYSEMYQAVMDKYGAVPFRYRPGIEWLYEKTGEYHHMLKRIKKAVDPNNILNPNLI